MNKISETADTESAVVSTVVRLPRRDAAPLAGLLDTLRDVPPGFPYSHRRRKNGTLGRATSVATAIRHFRSGRWPVTEADLGKRADAAMGRQWRLRRDGTRAPQAARRPIVTAATTLDDLAAAHGMTFPRWVA